MNGQNRQFNFGEHLWHTKCQRTGLTIHVKQINADR